MSQRISKDDGTAASDDALGERTARWTWWCYLQWSLLLVFSSLGMAIAATACFVLLVVIPLGYLFKVRLVGYAFHIPTLVVPVVWTLGMVRCYRRQSSATLMLALAATGVVLYVVLPAFLYFIVFYVVGGWPSL